MADLARAARLVWRASRRLSLTHEGERYLHECREILDKLAQAEAVIQQGQGKVHGKLKVTASMAMGITVLGEAFASFMQQYPGIELDTHLTDDSVDLIKDGFDLGFRAASRPFDASYVGKPLTKFQYRICASPSYLAKHGQINTPAQLAEHNCFENSYFRSGNLWPIDEGIAISGNMQANSTLWILEAVKKGLGIGFLPTFVCDLAIRQGQVVEVLPQCQRPELTLYAIYPNRRHVSSRVLACVNFIEDWFQQ